MRCPNCDEPTTPPETLGFCPSCGAPIDAAGQIVRAFATATCRLRETGGKHGRQVEIAVDQRSVGAGGLLLVTVAVAVGIGVFFTPAVESLRDCLLVMPFAVVAAVVLSRMSRVGLASILSWDDITADASGVRIGQHPIATPETKYICPREQFRQTVVQPLAGELFELRVMQFDGRLSPPLAVLPEAATLRVIAWAIEDAVRPGTSAPDDRSGVSTSD